MLTRFPHLGHTTLFLTIILLAFFPPEILLLAMPGHLHNLQSIPLQLAAQGLAYLLALAAAVLSFPYFWRTSFLAGLGWKGQAAHWWLVPAGLTLGFVCQAIEAHLPVPKTLPINALFSNPHILPTLALMAVLIAPLLEEVLFRGFLLPALASGWDYLLLPRGGGPDDAAAVHERWRISPSSMPALLVSSVITSALFALIHAPQLGFTWPAVGLLAAVSLVLCFIRICLHSVAASTLLHASYNLSVFLTLGYVTDGYRHLSKLH